MKTKLLVISFFVLLVLVLSGSASAQATPTAQGFTVTSKVIKINSLATPQLTAPFVKSIEISPTQTTNIQASCTACVGGEPTGQTDPNGCPIYSCPAKQCPAGCTCSGDTTTCPIKPSCESPCVKSGDTCTCPAKPYSCTACVGGEPTGQTDPNGCPIYSCPAKQCPAGCTCSGDTTTCPMEGTKPIEVKISSESGTKTVSIEKSLDGLSFKSEKATAITTETLVIEENKLSLKTSTGNKEIKILPEEASSKATAVTEVNMIELKEESQQPIYSVNGTKQAKLFFIIPVSMQIETKVNAESGNVISVKKPWWSFLTR